MVVTLFTLYQILTDPFAIDKPFLAGVTMRYTECVASGRTTKLLNKHATAQVPDKDTVLRFSRRYTLVMVLSSHDLHDRFVAGANWGPPSKLYWSGSPYVDLSAYSSWCTDFS